MTKSNYIYILIFLTAMISCKTTGKIAKKGATTDTIETLIKNVQLAEPAFKTANVSKISLAITYNTRKYNVSASCKIIKDSALFVSIQPMLGIELFKAEITPDSILLFDKMNRRLYALDYKYIYQKTGINTNFLNIQSIISNQLFCMGEIKIPTTKCTLKKDSNGKSNIYFNTEKLNQTTQIADNNTIEKVLISGAGSKYLATAQYSEYQINDSINFPMLINISMNSLRNNINCDFNIKKVTFNSNFTLSKSDISNYSRANIEQLLKK